MTLRTFTIAFAIACTLLTRGALALGATPETLGPVLPPANPPCIQAEDITRQITDIDPRAKVAVLHDLRASSLITALFAAVPPPAGIESEANRAQVLTALFTLDGQTVEARVMLFDVNECALIGLTLPPQTLSSLLGTSL